MPHINTVAVHVCCALLVLAVAVHAESLVPADAELAAPTSSAADLTTTGNVEVACPHPCATFTIAKGDYSQYGLDWPVFRGANLLIRDRHAWRAFWREHVAATNDEEFPPAPRVDFDHYAVIAAVQGPQNSGGGPSITIVEVVAGPAFTHAVMIDDPRPGPLDVITNPFHIVAIDRRCLTNWKNIAFDTGHPLRDTGVVTGRVIAAPASDTDLPPVANANVKLVGYDATGHPQVFDEMRSGRDGTFFFVNLPAGPYELVAYKPSFELAGRDIEVAANERLGVSILLEHLPVETAMPKRLP